jgi:hypothetical protein
VLSGYLAARDIPHSRTEEGGTFLYRLGPSERLPPGTRVAQSCASAGQEARRQKAERFSWRRERSGGYAATRSARFYGAPRLRQAAEPVTYVSGLSVTHLAELFIRSWKSRSYHSVM